MWSYLTYRNGILYDLDGDVAIAMMFANEDDATQYLVDNDIRATITNAE